MVHWRNYPVNELASNVAFCGETTVASNLLRWWRGGARHTICRDIFTSRQEGTIITLGLNYWDAPTVAPNERANFYDEACDGGRNQALDVRALAADQLLTIAEAATDLGNLTVSRWPFDLAYSGPFCFSVKALDILVTKPWITPPLARWLAQFEAGRCGCPPLTQLLTLAGW